MRIWDKPLTQLLRYNIYMKMRSEQIHNFEYIKTRNTENKTVVNIFLFSDIFRILCNISYRIRCGRISQCNAIGRLVLWHPNNSPALFPYVRAVRNCMGRLRFRSPHGIQSPIGSFLSQSANCQVQYNVYHTSTSFSACYIL